MGHHSRRFVLLDPMAMLRTFWSPHLASVNETRLVRERLARRALRGGRGVAPRATRACWTRHALAPRGS